MARGRALYADLDLLDRQMRDRDDRLCGKVDDLEIERAAGGQLYITAILSGPGTLVGRFGFRRLGRWLERFRHQIANAADPDGRTDPGRIPIDLVHRMGPVIDVAVSAEHLATFESERWVRDHVIGHVPGSRHDAGE